MSEPQEQQPSIGRIVHYSYKGARCAALVTFVHGPARLNLSVFGHNGELAIAKIEGSSRYGKGVDAPFHNPDGSIDPNKTAMTDGQWCWPPRV